MRLQDNENDNLITVIVPVYNVQNYLRKCLFSIQNQSWGNLEILLVDDGSTDESVKICKEFCNQDPRFFLIRQRHAGLGAARNTGIDHARGEYICFVDSDDVVHKDFVFILYTNMKKTGSDLSLCKYQNFENENELDKIIRGKPHPENIQVLEKKDLLKLCCNISDLSIEYGELVNAFEMVRTEWLGDFRFRNVWHEDVFKLNEYIKKCSKAVYTSDVLYFHRMRYNSITGALNMADKRHLNELIALEQRIKYFGRYDKDIYRGLLKEYILKCCYYYCILSADAKGKTYRKRILKRVRFYFPRFRTVSYEYKLDSDDLRITLFCIFPDLTRIYTRSKWRVKDNLKKLENVIWRKQKST